MGPWKALGGHGRPLRAAWGWWGPQGAAGSHGSPAFQNRNALHCFCSFFCFCLLFCFCSFFGHWGNPWPMPHRVATWVYEGKVYQSWVYSKLIVSPQSKKRYLTRDFRFHCFLAIFGQIFGKKQLSVAAPGGGHMESWGYLAPWVLLLESLALFFIPWRTYFYKKKAFTYVFWLCWVLVIFGQIDCLVFTLFPGGSYMGSYIPWDQRTNRFFSKIIQTGNTGSFKSKDRLQSLIAGPREIVGKRGWFCRIQYRVSDVLLLSVMRKRSIF
jgi:hypothetical protein